jgi:hypothetical protein
VTSKVKNNPMIALDLALARYWELIVQEKMPKTPEITKELDELEKEIQELKGKKKKTKK